jgi:hypothetical protein
MITKNHKTTTVLVAIAALSAILVAGSVAAASDHSAFAHKKMVNKKVVNKKVAKKAFVNTGILVPTITLQKQECETAGGTSAVTGSCTATSTNTVTESGGVMNEPEP